jgi:hypothetical protein
VEKGVCESGDAVRVDPKCVSVMALVWLGEPGEEVGECLSGFELGWGEAGVGWVVGL